MGFVSIKFRAAVTAVVSTFVGRVVLALYTFVVVPLMPALINFMNDVLGYSLTDAQVQMYASRASVAVGAVTAVWLLNLGLFERAVMFSRRVWEEGRGDGETVE